MSKYICKLCEYKTGEWNAIVEHMMLEHFTERTWPIIEQKKGVRPCTTSGTGWKNENKTCKNRD